MNECQSAPSRQRAIRANRKDDAMTNFHEMLSPTNCALTLIDFQPAMYQGVYSHDRLSVLHNTQVLAKAAKLFGVPHVLTTVAKDSFSGPMSPEITDVFPDSPIIDRTSINSWVDENFRKAIAATGRRKIVLAGLWTEACVMFPTLDMLREGYEVYVPTDACGDITPEAHERAVQRLIQAGAVPITALQWTFELQQDWARGNTYDGMMEILKAHTPYGIQVRFSKWALGEHASEAGH
jgi:nicotinamidase-related amidase